MSKMDALLTAGAAVAIGKAILAAPVVGPLPGTVRVEVPYAEGRGSFGGDIIAPIARKIGQLLVQHGHAAEVWEDPASTIFGAATLIRGGFRFGLTKDRDLLAEAWKASQHDPALRRYVRGSRARGLASVDEVSLPRLIDHGNGVPNGSPR